MASFEKLEGNKVKLGMTISAEDFERLLTRRILSCARPSRFPASARDMLPRELLRRLTDGTFLSMMLLTKHIRRCTRRLSRSMT